MFLLLNSLKKNIKYKNVRFISSLKKSIDLCSKERALQNIAPKILDSEQVNKLCDLLKNPIKSEDNFLLDQFKN